MFDYDTWVNSDLLLLTVDALGGAYSLTFLLMISVINNKLFILLYWILMNENILFNFFYDPDESE